MQKVIISVSGFNGQITLFENRIDITRKGFRAFMSHGFDGTKSIFLSKLSGIQFKEAGAMTRGYIQFIFSGSAESKDGLFDAAKDENTVMFDKKDEADFIKIRDFIFEKLQ